MIALALAVALQASEPNASPLTDGEIAEAVQWGTSNGFNSRGVFWQCGMATTPKHRVAWQAYKAKKEYKDFTRASFTDVVWNQLIAPEFVVSGFSQRTDEAETLVHIKAIVVVKDGVVYQPQRVLSNDVETYTTRMGAKFEAQEMTAIFPMTMGVPGAEIRVVTSEKPECRHTITEDELKLTVYRDGK